MYRLRCFGNPTLETALGERVRLIERHPKRFAVLIYLACRDRAPRARREVLLPVFWPDADESHARNALRQSIFILREFLGPRVLLGRDDGEIALDAARIQCDLWEFREHLRRGRWSEACSMEPEWFLHDFTVRDTPPFTDWTDRARHAVTSRTADAWARLADLAEARRDFAGAATAWGRALELAPHSERCLRKMITARVAAGDRAAAADAWARFQRRLAEDLELVPTPSTRNHVEAALAPGTPGEIRAGVEVAGAVKR